jgi:flagellar motor switch protein FliN/FliY
MTNVLHPEVAALLDAMRELAFHLEGRNDFWAANVNRAADEVAKSDAHGVKRFLSFFGGMGSLNDLVLCAHGTPLIFENEKLQASRSKAWELASALRREIG